MSRPRIRYLKPELWQYRDFLALSALGRLTFIALISNADDEGRLETDAGHIASAFMAGCLPDEIATQLDRMEAKRMVMAYGYRGDRFIAVLEYTGDAPWSQRIDHPTLSELPAPPKFKRRGSANKRQLVFDSLANGRERSRQIGADRSGPERKGSERTGPTSADAERLVLQSEVSLTPVQQVFRAWSVSTFKTAKTVLDDKRRRLIERALQTYPLEDVLDAVDGWRFDPHHRGENDRGRIYNDLELVLRDAKHIEQFRDFKREPLARPVAGNSTSRVGRLDRLYADAQRRAGEEGR